MFFTVILSAFIKVGDMERFRGSIELKVAVKIKRHSCHLYNTSGVHYIAWAFYRRLILLPLPLTLPSAELTPRLTRLQPKTQALGGCIPDDISLF